MARNSILETIPIALINLLALARTRLGSSNQPPAALIPSVLPLTSGVVMEPRTSKVLPGQMIMPLAWPVDERYGRPSQEE